MRVGRGAITSGLAALATLAGCGTALVNRDDRAGEAAPPQRFQSPESLGADRLPYPKARLILAGTEVPVDVVERREGETYLLHLMSHGEVIEEERYESDARGFRFVGGSGETFEPPIPLIRLPMTVGESWEWTGVAALGPNRKRASAKVVSASERLNLASGLHDTVRLVVDLSVEANPSRPAVRQLTFWIEPRRGVVRRQFGAGSTREPRPDADDGP